MLVMEEQRDWWRYFWDRSPAILAFSLLAIQLAIPWTVPHFVTQDGPSHLYNAIVLKKLFFHQQPYISLYRITPGLVPNWASTILFAICAAIAGATHAEQLMMTLVVCAGFFSLSYAIRAISPAAPRWTPISNFILEAWCLWMGFYNFYLGMLLVPLAIGYYVRRKGWLTAQGAVALGAGLILLYFVHLIAAAVAVLALAILAVWLHIARPVLWPGSEKDNAGAVLGQVGFKQIGLAFGAMIPPVLLCFIFTHGSPGGMAIQRNLHAIFQMAIDFPLNSFATSGGFVSDQWKLWPAMLGLIVIATLSMRPAEWRSAKGAIALSGLAVFALYLFAPDMGLGGLYVKVRFAWTVFIFGALLLSTVSKMQPLAAPIAIFVAALLALNLASTAHGVRRSSKAVEDYLSALNAIPPGSKILRVRYATSDVAERYGFEAIERDPLLHVDAYASALKNYLDISDYQAAMGYFPVIFSAAVTQNKQDELVGLENPKGDESAVLESLRQGMPVEIDYTILVADDSSPSGSAAKIKETLDSSMRLISQSPPPSFVRVYRRTGGQ